MENPQFQQVKDSAPFKRWPCVYPIYLDANVSLQGGRRVSKKYAYPDPLPRAIVEAVRRLKLPIFLEPQKVHPRESGSIRSGRIRVQLLDEDGKQIHPEIPNRNRLFEEIGKLIQQIQPLLPPKPALPPIPPHIAMLLEQVQQLEEAEKGKSPPASSPMVESEPTTGTTSGKEAPTSTRKKKNKN